MFRTGFRSIIRSLLLYTKQWVYVIQVMLTACKCNQDPTSKQSAKPVWHIPIAAYTVLDSWWWTESLSETRRVLFQKYIWEISASRWFYYKKSGLSHSVCIIHPYLLHKTVSHIIQSNSWDTDITVDEIKKVSGNMAPILNGYGAMCVF